jgi:DNA-binding GntR family transcriptional regulator
MSSLVDIAYNKIRENIMNANYMPGSLLSENELAEMLNMSRTPIRGAISRLESEGFVTSLKNRGIFVKEISFKEILDISEVLLFLQTYTVESVIEKGLSFNQEELKMYLDQQLEAEENDDYPKYIQCSMMFTRSMILSANNQMMLQMMDSIKDKIIHFAIVNWRLTPKQKHYSANILNKLIYEAICSGDYPKIKQICKETSLKNRERFIMTGGL